MPGKNVKKLMSGAVCFATLMLPLSMNAQTVAGATVNEEFHGDGHPFLLHLEGEGESQHGGWQEGNRLRTYADTHSGNYIVFLSDGALYRIDQADRLRAVEEVYEPLHELSRQQKALAAQQKPLSEQQRTLSTEMRAASSPAEMSRIGAEQGTIGRAQGEIGRQQGAVGKQQGVIGKQVFAKVQTMIDACLQNKSCAAVETAKL
jgi:hypothetical protein